MLYPTDIDDHEIRLKTFRAGVAKERSQYSWWAQRDGAIVNILLALAVVLAALSAVVAALPEDLTLGWLKIGRWGVTVPLAVSAAFYFIVRQLKLNEWTGWYYWRVDELDRIARKLNLESGAPPTPAELKEISLEYERMVVRLGKVADQISRSVATPPRPPR
jgi:hypothetical protein